MSAPNMENNIRPYSKAIVRLLKGTVERSNTVWNDIVAYQTEIEDYISVIGLELILKKDEGFVFVKQKPEDDSTLSLVSRQQIGHEASIVLFVLRQILDEFDNDPMTQSFEKFVTGTEIKDEVELFLRENYNSVKVIKDLDKCINRINELGYLVETSQKDNETRYRIHRIIKEKITLDDLLEFKNKIQATSENSKIKACD
jgi:hypothetical protein